MNEFDRSILLWLNQLARRWPALDLAVAALAGANLLKGGLLVTALLWFWFAESPAREARRRTLVATAVACVVAVAAGRLLAQALPFRARPIDQPGLGFVAPYGYADGMLRGWSAFPSDHAMLFAALVTGLWLLARPLGAAAALYAAVFIGLPRIYMGMHHPTDVLGGAALGLGLALAANAPPVRERLARLPLRWLARRPGAFHAAAFLAALQVATMFGDARELLSRAVVAARVARCGDPGLDARPRCRETWRFVEEEGGALPVRPVGAPCVRRDRVLGSPPVSARAAPLLACLALGCAYGLRPPEPPPDLRQRRQAEVDACWRGSLPPWLDDAALATASRLEAQEAQASQLNDGYLAGTREALAHPPPPRPGEGAHAGRVAATLDGRREFQQQCALLRSAGNGPAVPR